MKQNIKHIIILILALMATISAEATTKVVTYTMNITIDNDYVSHYYLESSSGESIKLNADVNNSYSLPKTFTLQFADVNLTVISSGDKGHIAYSGLFWGFQGNTYTFTFESTDYFVTHVKVSSHAQYPEYLDAYSLTKSCSATWTLTNEYVRTFEVTLVDRFDISKATVGGINTSYDYTGSAIKPEPTSVTYTLNGLTATLTKNTDYTIGYSNNTNAGTATMTLTGIGDYTGTWSTTFTINPVAATVTAPTARTNLTYNGSSQALCTAGSCTGGTLRYSTNNGSSWTTTVPTATNAGTYTLCYKLDADANHISIAKTSLGTVTIAARERTFGNISITETGVAATTTAVIADGTDEISIPQNITVGSVTFNRTFTVDASSTVMLPFSIAVSKVSGGTFYGFVGVDKNIDGWEVVMQQVDPSGTLNAHTPYLFKPSATQMTFNLGGETVTLKANTQSTYSTITQ